MELQNNRYNIQGVDLIALTQEMGSPVYVYDGAKIVSQINTLKKAFSGLPLEIKYATKALTNISILKLIRQQGCGVDAVSIQEAQIAMKAGFKPSEILFTPNCVGFEEIKEAVNMGLIINIDNLSILEQFGKEYGHSKACCIRINPHIMAGGNHKISTGHIDSKFGISVLQVNQILEVVKAHDIWINGLHMHTGSDILESEVFLRGADILFDIAKHFDKLEFIDFGSGFKVAYKEGDIVTDIMDLGQKLGAAFRAFCKNYGRDLQIWFEPGKFLVSEAGYLLVTANVIKTTPANIFIGVDSGMNHLIRPMMYDAYHHITNISNPKGDQHVYSVVGYICETDNLGWDRKLNEARVGDVIAIHNAGAYGYSMSSNYNSRFRPAEVLILDGKAHLIRRRENLEDVLNTQIEANF